LKLGSTSVVRWRIRRPANSTPCQTTCRNCRIRRRGRSRNLLRFHWSRNRQIRTSRCLIPIRHQGCRRNSSRCWSRCRYWFQSRTCHLWHRPCRRTMSPRSHWSRTCRHWLPVSPSRQIQTIHCLIQTCHHWGHRDRIRTIPRNWNDRRLNAIRTHRHCPLKSRSTQNPPTQNPRIQNPRSQMRQNRCRLNLNLQNRCRQNRRCQIRCLRNRCLRNRCLRNRCLRNRCRRNRCRRSPDHRIPNFRRAHWSHSQNRFRRCLPRTIRCRQSRSHCLRNRSRDR